MSDKNTIALIFGGRSSEHEVSIMSAKSIYQALDKDKYEIIPIAITKEGKWLTPKISRRVLEDGKITTEEDQIVLIPDSKGGYLQGIEGNGKLKISIDIVFPVLHGPFGEDGTIQGLLEMSNLAYVGAGVAPSAAGMDKGMMKDIFKSKGLPQGQYQVIYRYMLEKNLDGVIEQLEDSFNYPCFIKPANLGSSVGVSKVHNRDEMPGALKKAAEHDRKIIVEEFINARELEVSVLGNDHIKASVAGEIIPDREFYDYDSKYKSNDSKLLIPAPLDGERMIEIRSLALQAYRAIDCQGFARIDFFIDRDTDQILINEINTIPGFTRISMYPKLWEASGLPYPELVERLIQLSIERYEDMKKNKF